MKNHRFLSRVANSLRWLRDYRAHDKSRRVFKYCRLERELSLGAAQLLPRARKENARIDWSAIATVLVTGKLFGDLSPFVGVSTPFTQRKKPAIDVITTENLKWSNMLESDRLGCLNDLYDTYDEILRLGISSVPANWPTVMGLSGGRDSRNIVLAINGSGRSLPRLVTSEHFIPNLSDADVAVAKLIASRLGTTVQTVRQPRDRFLVEWEKNIRTGMQTLAHSWGLTLADALEGPEVLYDGMNGGLLFGRMTLLQSVMRKFGNDKPSSADLRQHALHEYFDKRVSLFADWLPPCFVSDEMISDIRERLSGCFSQYEIYPNPVQAFLHGEHARRNTRLFTYELMKNKYIVCPYDTREMIEFAFSLPWLISYDSSFQTNATNFKYPTFSDIPYTISLQDPPPTWKPDKKKEEISWQRLRKVLNGYLGEAVLASLDQTRGRLDVIQRSTLLTQAIFWEENGYLPDAGEFFG